MLRDNIGKEENDVRSFSSYFYFVDFYQICTYEINKNVLVVDFEGF